MKIAPGQRQHLNNLTAQCAHLRMNVEVYKEKTKQQTKDTNE